MIRKFTLVFIHFSECPALKYFRAGRLKIVDTMSSMMLCIAAREFSVSGEQLNWMTDGKHDHRTKLTYIRENRIFPPGTHRIMMAEHWQ